MQTQSSQSEAQPSNGAPQRGDVVLDNGNHSPRTHPAELQELQSRLLVSERRTLAAYSGPIPPASELEKYDKIHPGLANRIISMTEGEVVHRREMEKNTLNAQILELKQDGAEIKRGQIAAVVVTVFTIAAGTLAAMYGHDVAGGIIGVGGVGGIVTSLIMGRNSSPQSAPLSKQSNGRSNPPRKQRKKRK